MPVIGADSGRPGAPGDRNAELRMTPPFPLERVTAW